MTTGTMEVIIRVSWAHSLKDKRSEVKSLCAKVRNKFNVSIAEVDSQDKHQMIVLGIACVGTDQAYVDSVLDRVIDLIESTTDGEIIETYRRSW